MRPWLTPPPKRLREASDQQLIATGAVGAYGAYGYDPIDHDKGFTPLTGNLRQVPIWTIEKARAFSVAAYRSNPMARAIIDTYTSFCVGDSGLTLQCTSDDVRPIAEEFWTDPANHLETQDLMLRTHLIYGETLYEMLRGPNTGVVRRSVIDPTRIANVMLDGGNPLWPAQLEIRSGFGTDADTLDLIRMDDLSGLLNGEALWWRSFRALETDLRGDPFLSPVLDWLDSYDNVMSNLIDRTALARHLVYDVTLKRSLDGSATASQKDIDEYVKQRGNLNAPRSGSIEVHTDAVEWNNISAKSESAEDTATALSVMTSIAAGTGLAKTWLAEPDRANRATSMTMAEPVRRRIGGVQNVWLSYMTEMARFAVDQAVGAGRIAPMVSIKGPGEAQVQCKASSTVTITGPAIAAADAQVMAQVIFNLSQGLQLLTTTIDPTTGKPLLSTEAATVAAQKAWEGFVGVPYTPALDGPGMDPDQIAEYVAAAQKANPQKVAGAPLQLIMAGGAPETEED